MEIPLFVKHHRRTLRRPLFDRIQVPAGEGTFVRLGVESGVKNLAELYIAPVQPEKVRQGTVRKHYGIVNFILRFLGDLGLR